MKLKKTYKGSETIKKKIVKNAYLKMNLLMSTLSKSNEHLVGQEFFFSHLENSDSIYCVPHFCKPRKVAKIRNG